jgi:hypothetical protein
MYYPHPHWEEADGFAFAARESQSRSHVRGKNVYARGHSPSRRPISGRHHNIGPVSGSKYPNKRFVPVFSRESKRQIAANHGKILHVSISCWAAPTVGCFTLHVEACG